MKKMSFVFTLLAAAAMLLSACGPAATDRGTCPCYHGPGSTRSFADCPASHRRPHRYHGPQA